MDALEQIVLTILKHQGYLTLHSYPIDNNKLEPEMIRRKKDKLTRISIVGFHIQKRELILCEVKAFFDSRGYTMKLFSDSEDRFRKNVPLFFNEAFYRRIQEILVEELGLIPEKLNVKRLLCFGNIQIGRRDSYQEYKEAFAKAFAGQRVEFWGPLELYEEFRKLSRVREENDVVVYCAKLLRKAKSLEPKYRQRSTA